MRILVLTHTFPPSNHSNAKRPFYVVKGLLEAGWHVDVVTSWLRMPKDTPESLVHDRLRIFRLREPMLEWILQPDGQMHPKRGLFLTGSGLAWPDVCICWSWQAVRYARRHGPYDRTLVFILPASLLVAGVLQRAIHRSWIFDYQESVTPFQQRQKRRSPLGQLLQPLLARLERRALHKSGGVIFTSECNRQAYLGQRLAAGRTAHIPYFYDSASFATRAAPDPACLDIHYFGAFDWRGARSPETFLRSLQKFLRTHPDARDHTRFNFYGQWLEGHTQLVQELGLSDITRVQPPLAYEAYLRQLSKCGVLLLIVSPIHNLFMPSKIVDYLGAQRPILAFVPPDSEMHQVLTEAGMHEFLVNHDDVSGGADALARLWRQHQNQTLAVDAAQTTRWADSFQMPRYIKLVETASTANTDSLWRCLDTRMSYRTQNRGW